MSRKLRKLTGLLILAATFFGFGCSSSEINNSLEKWMEDNGKIKVLSTTAMIDDLVAAIGKERIDHLSLIQGQVDPHAYELVKGDDEKLSLAQILFYNGLGLEHGASLRYQLSHHPKAVALGDEVQKRSPERILKKGGVVDPHIWMDISLWEETVDTIVQTLSIEDPSSTSFFQTNGEELKRMMETQHHEIKALFQGIPVSKRYLVTSHDAFNYFVRAYLAEPGEDGWEERCAAPEGIAPEGQLSTSDIQKIIDHLFLHQIAVIFPESNLNRDALKKITAAAREKGLDVQLSQVALYGDAMGEQSDQPGMSYLLMVKHNADVISQAWSR